MNLADGIFFGRRTELPKITRCDCQMEMKHTVPTLRFQDLDSVPTSAPVKLWGGEERSVAYLGLCTLKWTVWHWGGRDRNSMAAGGGMHACEGGKAVVYSSLTNCLGQIQLQLTTKIASCECTGSCGPLQLFTRSQLLWGWPPAGLSQSWALAVLCPKTDYSAGSTRKLASDLPGICWP